LWENGKETRMRPSRGTGAVIALIIITQVAAGCSSHLDVVRGVAPPSSGELNGSVAVEVVPQYGGPSEPVEGVPFELFHEDPLFGEVPVGEFATLKERPFRIDELPPGKYRVRVYLDAIGDEVLERRFELHEGESVLIAYDDQRDDRARDLNTVKKGLEVAGIALAITTLVAIDVALIVLSCGRCRPICYRLVTK
jgi:hypothetical protein